MASFLPIFGNVVLSSNSSEGGFRPPPLRSNLIAQEQTHRGQPYVLLKDPATHAFFRLSAPAYRVALRLDARTSEDELARSIRSEEGLDVDVEEVTKLVGHLQNLGLLDQRLSNAEIAARQRRMTGERRSMTYLKWPLFNPDRILGRMLGALGPIFSRPVLYTGIGLVGIAVVLHVLYPDLMSEALSSATRGHGLLWLYGATALTLTLHELAHGLTSKRFGADVDEMGLLLLLFMPCAYTDISNAYLVPNKWDRIRITLAGSAADLIVWALAVIILVVTRPGAVMEQALGALILTTGYRSVALNLNPLIKLDGYYVLVDLLEMPNLRQRSRTVVVWRLKRWLGRSIPAPGENTRDRRVLELYGWLSTLYVTALLSLTAVWLDRWLVGHFGAWGRLAYPGLLVIAVWVVWNRRHAGRRPISLPLHEESLQPEQGGQR